MTSHWDTIATERRALADVLETLTPEQWETPSLCEAWTVRGVVAHLVTPLDTTAGEAASALLRSRGRPPRMMTALAEPRTTRATDHLVRALRDHADRRTAPPGLGSVAPLTDLLVHRQDVLLPLGIPDDRPVEPYGPALDFVLSARACLGFRSRWRPRLTYVATDLGLSSGQGPRVEGPAAALTLALLRRTARLDELDGPGAEPLRRWARGESR